MIVVNPTCQVSKLLWMHSFKWTDFLNDFSLKTKVSHSADGKKLLMNSNYITVEKLFQITFLYSYKPHFEKTYHPVPRGFSVQDLKFFISCTSWFSDLKFLVSDRDKNWQISDLKFGSQMENFRSEVTLKNKISDLKLDLRIFCWSIIYAFRAKHGIFIFWCFCNTQLCLG